MYMNNGIGMRIILTQINLISPNLQGYSCLRPVAWILSLHVTRIVTRMVLPHLWLLIGMPLVKTLWIWMWIKANLDFWHLLFFWNQPRPLIYFTGPSWFKKKKRKKNTSAGVVTNAWVTTYGYTILAIFVTIATTPQSILCDVKNDVHNQHLFTYHVSSS